MGIQAAAPKGRAHQKDGRKRFPQNVALDDEFALGRPLKSWRRNRKEFPVSRNQRRINAHGDDAYRDNADGCASTLRADADDYAVRPAGRQQHVHAGDARRAYASGHGRALHAHACDYAARLDVAKRPTPSVRRREKLPPQLAR